MPLVTTPISSPSWRTGLPSRGIPLILDLEGDEDLGRALGASAGDRLGADEPGLLLAAPAEARFDRVALRTQLVAVQRITDLQPQRVAGAEPAGDDAGVQQLCPDRRRDLGVDQQLDPVLAGVAGAADQGRATADLGVRDVEAIRQRDPQRRSENRPSVRPLNGKHRVAIGNVTNDHVKSPALPSKPSQIALVIGRVGDDQVAVATEPVSEEVVEDTTALPAKARVLGTADRDLGDVIREHPLKERQGSRSLNLNLPHMRHIEHPDMPAHRRVLLPNPLISNGHLPTSKRNNFRPKLNMLLVERSAPEVSHEAPRLFVGGGGCPSHKGSRSHDGAHKSAQLRDGLWGRGTHPRPNNYSLRNPGTSMSSSDTRSFRMSVSSAETRGRLS